MFPNIKVFHLTHSYIYLYLLYKQNFVIDDAPIYNIFSFNSKFVLDCAAKICNDFPGNIKKEFHERQFFNKLNNILKKMKQNQYNEFKEFKAYCCFIGQKIIDNNIVNASLNIQNQIIQCIYYYKVKREKNKKKKAYQCIHCGDFLSTSFFFSKVNTLVNLGSLFFGYG